MVWKFTLHWNLKNLRTNFNTTIWKLETISTVPIDPLRNSEDWKTTHRWSQVPATMGQAHPKCKHALFPRVQQASAGSREETSSSPPSAAAHGRCQCFMSCESVYCGEQCLCFPGDSCQWLGPSPVICDECAWCAVSKTEVCVKKWYIINLLNYLISGE